MALYYIDILVFGESVHFESCRLLETVPEHRIGSSSRHTTYCKVSRAHQLGRRRHTGIEEKVVSLCQCSRRGVFPVQEWEMGMKKLEISVEQLFRSLLSVRFPHYTGTLTRQ